MNMVHSTSTTITTAAAKKELTQIANREKMQKGNTHTYIEQYFKSIKYSKVLRTCKPAVCVQGSGHNQTKLMRINIQANI